MHLDVLELTIMEARNVLTARDMLTYDNWFLTTLNGEPRYQKPPLPTWIVALSSGIFNTESLSVLRLPSALISTSLVLTLYHFVKRLTANTTQALIAGLVLATSFYVVFAGRQATWDIFTHSFMLVGIYFLYRFLTKKRGRCYLVLLSGLFIGLSMLSKGPVSVYALFLPFVLAYVSLNTLKLDAGRLKALLVLVAIAIIIGSSWYVYVYVFDAETLSAITNRETNAWQDRNTRPIYYYWSFFLQSGAWSIIALCSLLFPFVKKDQPNLKAYKLCALWVFFSLILLSVIPEKKSRYLLPVLIPLAATISFYLKCIFNYTTRQIKLWRWPAKINFYSIALVGLVFPIAFIILEKGVLSNYWFISLAIVLLAVSIMMIRALFKDKLRLTFFLSIAFVCCVTTFGFPLVDYYNLESNSDSIVDKKTRIKTTNLPLYTFSNEHLELLWAYGEQIPVVTSCKATTDFLVMVSANNQDFFEYYFLMNSYSVFEEIDINKVPNDSRHYKNRKRATIYKISN